MYVYERYTKLTEEFESEDKKIPNISPVQMD